jgi:hypothetical protein
MDTTYRLRFLIYLAAFMLMMSVCFVYAETVPSRQPSQSHLLFQIVPQHVGFLAPLTGEPAFDPDALRTSVSPLVSPVVLQQLQDASHSRHWFLHRAKHTLGRTPPAALQNESSVPGLGAALPSALNDR